MMKYFAIAAVLAVATFTTSTFAADVGMSVSIGQPGFYGRLDVGDYPQPRVIYVQPRVIERVARDREPIYLRVPPGYARNWRRHCDEYDASGERVYFVQDNWYNHEYAPRYREQHHDYENDHDHDHGDGYGNHNNNHDGEHHNNENGGDHQGDNHEHGDEN